MKLLSMIDVIFSELYVTSPMPGISILFCLTIFVKLISISENQEEKRIFRKLAILVC